MFFSHPYYLEKMQSKLSYQNHQRSAAKATFKARRHYHLDQDSDTPRDWLYNSTPKQPTTHKQKCANMTFKTGMVQQEEVAGRRGVDLP